MTPETVLSLGDVVFNRFEVPPSINFGGEQALVVHSLPGGVNVVDAMGALHAPIAWGGMFQGANALSRARYLDGLRAAGKPLVLTWSELGFIVVIKSFRPVFERAFEIPYTIECVVVSNVTMPVNDLPDPGIDEWIDADMATANSLGASIGDGPLSGLLGNLNSAISAVSSFATAAQSTINSVLAPIAAVQARVQVLTASVTNTINSVSTLGGILPNNPIAQQTAKLTGQVAAMTQAPLLLQLGAVTGRMGANLSSLTTSMKSITTAGGNLFQIAQQKMGDAMQWAGIARANNLTDPAVQGVQTLKIPAPSNDSSGVMNA